MKFDPIDEIKKLGLNEYEARVYLALMERETLGVSEISKLSKVPRVRTYDILDKLVGRGLASLKPGKYMKYSAVDFDSLGDKLINEVEKRYNDERETIQKVTLTLKRNFEEARQKQQVNTDGSVEYIEIIKDAYQIHRKFMELVVNARHEILNFVKPPYSIPAKQTLKERNSKEADMINRGVLVRVMYEIPTDPEEAEWRFHDIEASMRDGEQARVIKELPLKMAVFDEEIVMLPLLDPIAATTSFTAQLVQHSSLAKALKILFETLWDQGEDHHVLLDVGKQEKSQ